MNHRIKSSVALLFLTLIQFCAMSQSQKFNINIGATLILRVVDQYINDGVKTDNSVPEMEKYISVSAEIDPVYISGNKFKGVSYSNSFFMYKEFIYVEGEFTPDKKTILWLEFDYKKTLFSGDPEISMYSTDETVMYFKIQNIPLKRTNIYESNTGQTSFSEVKYEKLYFGESTHNRIEVYEEYYIRPAAGINAFRCDVTILNGTPFKERGVTVRVSPLSKTENSYEISGQNYLASVIIADLSKIPGVALKEGMLSEWTMNEGMLVESGLVQKENSIDPDIQRIMLEMIVDIAVFISAKMMIEENNTPAMLYTVMFTQGDNMVTLDQTIHAGESITSFLNRVTTNISHEIHRLMEME